MHGYYTLNFIKSNVLQFQGTNKLKFISLVITFTSDDHNVTVTKFFVFGIDHCHRRIINTYVETYILTYTRRYKYKEMPNFY